MVQADILHGLMKTTPSKLLVDEVFSIMTRDEITHVAQNDALIVSLGESWLRRSIDNRLKRKYYSSQHMRQCGRFLIELRKLANHESMSMSDCIKPENYDMAARAALNISKPQMDDETELEAPSNAIKFKFDLLRIAHCKIAFALKNKLEEAARDAEQFLKVIHISWAEQVTRLARSVLNQRNLNETVQLPCPEDIKRLNEYLTTSLNSLDLKKDIATYRRAVKLVQARLLCYNKRRSGELEATL
jgi:hypothetical protein